MIFFFFFGGEEVSSEPKYLCNPSFMYSYWPIFFPEKRGSFNTEMKIDVPSFSVTAGNLVPYHIGIVAQDSFK